MSVMILAVGKIKEKFYKDALNEYVKRLSRYCKMEIVEVPDEKTVENASEIAEDKIREKEAVRILKCIREDAYVIALAIQGKKYDSVQFSKRIENLEIQGKSNIVFLIGGSLGLHHILLNRADEQISFSDMTFPHQLMRVILLEQIYRAYRIRNHEPYHK